MNLNIGMISTRFSGTDGVALEAVKWCDIFESNGHTCFWFAGELDRNPQNSVLVPEAHLNHSLNEMINEKIYGTQKRQTSITESIHRLRSLLKKRLYQFVNQFKIDFLIVENALTIPMHIPLGLALSEFIAETQIPTIAHHHDFYWERKRFLVNAVSDYLHMAFPPNLPNIKHVVINSDAQEQLALRTGISSIIIPNVLDFENPPLVDLSQSKLFRQTLGLNIEDIIILQPTRIIQRKGIEHAIELVKELNAPQYKLVISHKAGDEGLEYAKWLKDYACEHSVDLRFIETQLAYPGTCRLIKRHQYTLWDVYSHADFVTYPSLSEGFGNAFLEAVYFRKPMLINRYATFVRDIEPLGFDLVVMDGYLTKLNVQSVSEILNANGRKDKMVNLNYEIAKKHFSYSVLRSQLNPVLRYFFGDSIKELLPTEFPPLTVGCLDIKAFITAKKKVGMQDYEYAMN